MAYESIEDTIDIDAIRASGAVTENDDDIAWSSDDTPAEKNKPVKPAVPADDDFEIDIVDDRPPDDRGKKNAHDIASKDFDDSEITLPGDSPDEREEYVQRAQQRIKETTFRYHAERRSREEAERKTAAAFELAKSYMQQLQQTQVSYKDNEKFAIASMADAAQRNVNLLTDQLIQAQREQDPETIVKVTSLLHEEQLKLAQLKAYRPQEFRAPDPEKDFAAIVPQYALQQPARPQVDDATLAWARRNPWFNSDAEMTTHAHRIDKELQARGVNPLTDEKTYFTTIDKEMRRRFANYPWLGQTRSAQPPPVVTPGARPSPNKVKGKVTLTRSQLDVARRLGITPEAYAKELMKLKTGGNP